MKHPGFLFFEIFLTRTNRIRMNIRREYFIRNIQHIFHLYDDSAPELDRIFYGF